MINIFWYIAQLCHECSSRNIYCGHSCQLITFHFCKHTAGKQSRTTRVWSHAEPLDFHGAGVAISRENGAALLRRIYHGYGFTCSDRGTCRVMRRRPRRKRLTQPDAERAGEGLSRGIERVLMESEANLQKVELTWDIFIYLQEGL